MVPERWVALFLHPLSTFVGGVRLTAGPVSFYRFLRLRSLRPEPTTLRVRALASPIYVRPATADTEVIWGVFHGLCHLPPVPLAPDARILDLGANIGLTAAHYATLYPRATIVAVELDDGNAAMAVLNTQPWRDRITVINAAAWWETTRLMYSATPGEEYGLHVSPDGDRGVDAIAVGELVDRHGPIDFLKMDVEGAERQILTHETGWASSVGAIQIELHEDYTIEACSADLRRIGFEPTAVRTAHPLSVSAVRAR